MQQVHDNLPSSAETSSGRSRRDGVNGYQLEYANGGDGGDVRLKAVARHGRRHYQVSVLEVVDGNTPDDTIEQIESYWKSKLLTRRFGLNAN